MPILELQRRMRELGRIRIGEKGTKGAPKRLDTFRLTSPSLEILKHASGLYGGIPRPWEGSPGEGRQYELTTQAAELEVYVPSQDIDSMQWFEAWSGGGCLRRCDGAYDMVRDAPCSCDPDERTCKPTTHLLLMLPELPDVGVWRLVTHGWNAAAELPGTVAMLRELAGAGGTPKAVLAIESRTAKAEGQTHHFAVPVLRVPWSLAQAELAGVPVLATGRPALVSTAVLPEDEGSDPSFTHQAAESSEWGAPAPLPEEGESTVDPVDGQAASQEDATVEAASPITPDPGVSPFPPGQDASVGGGEPQHGGRSTPATDAQWERAKAIGITGAVALRRVRERHPDVKRKNDITSGQLEAVIGGVA